jgi:hypothetical protein
VGIELAGMEGILAKRNGCIGFEAPTGGGIFTVIVWPAGTSATADGVRTLDGTEIALGDVIEGTGGYSTVERERVRENAELAHCLEEADTREVFQGLVGPADE